MELPPFLYRSVTGYDASDNHLKGNLWFRSHAYFQELEGGDKLEGIGSYDIPYGVRVCNISDDYPVQPTYFLSFSEDPNATKKFGDRHLRLESPVALRMK